MDTRQRGMWKPEVTRWGAGDWLVGCVEEMFLSGSLCIYMLWLTWQPFQYPLIIQESKVHNMININKDRQKGRLKSVTNEASSLGSEQRLEKGKTVRHKRNSKRGTYSGKKKIYPAGGRAKKREIIFDIRSRNEAKLPVACNYLLGKSLCEENCLERKKRVCVLNSSPFQMCICLTKGKSCCPKMTFPQKRQLSQFKYNVVACNVQIPLNPYRHWKELRKSLSLKHTRYSNFDTTSVTWEYLHLVSVMGNDSGGRWKCNFLCSLRGPVHCWMRIWGKSQSQVKYGVKPVPSKNMVPCKGENWGREKKGSGHCSSSPKTSFWRRFMLSKSKGAPAMRQ